MLEPGEHQLAEVELWFRWRSLDRDDLRAFRFEQGGNPMLDHGSAELENHDDAVYWVEAIP
jgi:hypothetical protein